MRVFLIFVILMIFICFFFIASSSIKYLDVKKAQSIAEAESQINSELQFNASAADWYKGGSLHKATAGSWHKATAQNQLATAADFVAGAKAANSMNQLKTRATLVQNCISLATSDPKLYDLKVSEVGALCLIQLGYK